ncbi:hypothetical protein NQ315_011702 [Exocentrus adspersus]|uniref:Uncharacterized protein n=1 Tax=Exocentrus adspersus TaxID=1586481 RepID=A0AAV8W0E5_9CUCU|nr:hypothetical protein NQ315_011702 [Exocentrus adspersus]
MACTDGALLTTLKNIVAELENGGQAQQPVCCPPQTQPFPACCHVCPPPILAPTKPEPVKPLQLPCPYPDTREPEMSQEEAENTRFANFYNNYNVDYRAEAAGKRNGLDPYGENKSQGVTIDGKSPSCPEHLKKKKEEPRDQGVSQRFQTLFHEINPAVRLSPLRCVPCPPKRKNVSEVYQPKKCTRPCCKHWKPKDGECKYDGVCKAHCFEPPPRPRRKSA